MEFTSVDTTYVLNTLVRWERVTYHHPSFFEEHRIGMGPTTPPTKMTRNQLNSLAAQIKSEINAATAQTDVAGLKAFLELINLTLPRNTATAASAPRRPPVPTTGPNSVRPGSFPGASRTATNCIACWAKAAWAWYSRPRTCA